MKITTFRQFPLAGNILLILFPFLLIAWAGSQYNNKLSLRSSGYYHLSSGEISYFEDVSGVMNPAQIMVQNFQPLPPGSSDANFGFNPHTIWLRVRPDITKISFFSIYLEINNPLLNEIEAYEIIEKGPVLLSRTGDHYAYASRPIEARTYRFPVNIDRNHQQEFLLKITSGGEQLIAPIAIWTEEAMAEHDYSDNLLRGSYFGLIIFVLFFTLFLYLRIQEKFSLYYLHYNINLLLLQFALSGYAFQFLWPGNSYLANIATPLFASLSIFSLMRFSQHFLQIENYFPRVNRLFTYLSYLVFANALLSLVPHPVAFHVSVVSVNIIALLLNLAIIPVAALILRKGFKPARFFLIGFITLVFTVFGFIATNLGFIRNEFYAEYGLLIGSAAESVLLSFAVVDRFRSFREQALESLKELNRLEREQNEILEKTVIERTEEISRQNEMLATQQEEILSSIRYAERIQKNLLPREETISESFAESFVFYRPKDIVSGDFYWLGKTRLNGVSGPAHEVTVLASGDCTGHGIPGAMVSVMGCNLLRETLQSFPEASPSQMLDEIDLRLRQNMSFHSGVENGDGMDVAICAFQHDSYELRVAGANHDIFIWDGNILKTIPGVSRGIGASHHFSKQSFATTSVQLKKGDVVYTYSDGITDQFGGEKNKKLKTSGFRKWLEEMAVFPLSQQKEMLSKLFEEWKGDNEQTDDVCVLAFRV